MMADRIVETLNLRPGEKVILRADPIYFRELVAPVRQRLQKAGAGDIMELAYVPIGAPASQGRSAAPDPAFEKLLESVDVYIWLPEQVGVRGTPPGEVAALGEWLDKGGEAQASSFPLVAGKRSRRWFGG